MGHLAKCSHIVVEMKLRNPMLAEFSPMDALASFRTQFKAYIRGEDPFNRKMRMNESALGWWKALQRDELANVLAVSLRGSRIQDKTKYFNSLSQSRLFQCLRHPCRMNAPCQRLIGSTLLADVGRKLVLFKIILKSDNGIVSILM